MSLWNHRLDQNTNEIFDNFCPGPLRAEIIKYFVGILVQTMTSKRHFEINWPLAAGLFEKMLEDEEEEAEEEEDDLEGEEDDDLEGEDEDTEFKDGEEEEGEEEEDDE